MFKYYATLISGIALIKSLAIPHRPSGKHSRTRATLTSKSSGQTGYYSLVRFGYWHIRRAQNRRILDRCAPLRRALIVLAARDKFVAPRTPSGGNLDQGAALPSGWLIGRQNSVRGSTA